MGSCWLASLYCFEYRWVYLGWNSNDRLGYFERHWMYFFGFGFPIGVLSFVSPRFIDNGIFALVFPIFILTSAIARPTELRSERFRRLPIFKINQYVTTFLLSRIEQYTLHFSQINPRLMTLYLNIAIFLLSIA